MISKFLKHRYHIGDTHIWIETKACCPTCNNIIEEANLNNLPEICPICGAYLDWNIEGVDYHNPKYWKHSIYDDYIHYVEWCLNQPKYFIKRATDDKKFIMVIIATTEEQVNNYINYQAVSRNNVKIEDADERTLFWYMMMLHNKKPTWEETVAI